MTIKFYILPLALAFFLLPCTTLAAKADPKPEAEAVFEITTHEQDPESIEEYVKGLTPTIEQACNGERNKALCIKTFNANPASKTADLRGLTFMSLNWTRVEAVTIAQWIDQRSAKLKKGAPVDQGLADCSDMYTDAVAQLDEALDSFATTAQFTEIITLLTAAMSDADTCLDGLRDQKVIDLMSNYNQVFTKYCATALNSVLNYVNFVLLKDA